MSWLKWLLLFVFMYGALTMRKDISAPPEAAHFDGDNSPSLDASDSAPTTSLIGQIKDDDPNAKESLSYAFNKLSSASSSRGPSSFEDQDSNESISNLDLERILSLKNRPSELIVEADAQLARLSREELPERIMLLREVIGARSTDTMYQIEDLFERERLWLAQESHQINNVEALSSYINELTRLCLMTDSGSETPSNILQEITDAVSNNPIAIESLRRSVQSYIPWEYKNWNQQFKENR